jgi:hypothetical protein
MAPVDADESPEPEFQTASPSRLCEKCNSEMRQLGAFPAIVARAAVKIFRCYDCNNVVSDEA